jgi:hypothetical protein
MVTPYRSNRAIFETELRSTMLNERRLDPFEAHKSSLTGGIITLLTLASTMGWLHLVVGFSPCDVYDVLATDT